MNILEVVKQPVNLVFLVFVVVLFILGKVIHSINQYLTIIVTIVWFIFSFFGYSNDSGYTTIWFAGTLTWLIWLLEASKTQSESYGSLEACPWITGSDALFWSMSVPLWAIFIGLWARTFIEQEDVDKWAAFVGVMTLGYAVWLTLWRLSCIMPFTQATRRGGLDYSPIDP